MHVHVCFHPRLCEANTPPRMSSPFSNSILTLEVAFEISTDAFTACSENQTEGNFTCKRLTATYCCPHCFFLIQASLLTQSQMLQGLPDPPPLHPTLMRNHMTTMLTHLAVLILHTLHFHQLLHRIQEETGERRGVQQALCRRMGLSLLRWM